MVCCRSWAKRWGVTAADVIPINSSSLDDDSDDERKAAQLTVSMSREFEEGEKEAEEEQ